MRLLNFKNVIREEVVPPVARQSIYSATCSLIPLTAEPDIHFRVEIPLDAVGPDQSHDPIPEVCVFDAVEAVIQAVPLSRSIVAPFGIQVNFAREQTVQCLNIVVATSRLVVGNPNPPVALFTTLAADEHRYVRMKVAKHPNTPPEVLVELLEGPSAS